MLPHSLTTVDLRYFGYRFYIKKDKAVFGRSQGLDFKSMSKSTITRNKDFARKTIGVESLKSLFSHCSTQNLATVKRDHTLYTRTEIYCLSS